MLIQLFYVSSATDKPSQDDLEQLLIQARKNNLQHHITGLLLYHEGTYFQVLEGEYNDVTQLVDNISHDPRNTGFIKLSESPIDFRRFPDWFMGFKNLEEINTENLPGFVDIFNNRLDKQAVIDNKGSAIRLIMRFSNETSPFDASQI